MAQHGPAKPAGKGATEQEMQRNKKIDSGHPDAEPKGLPTSDRYHTETAHADEAHAHAPHKAGKDGK